MTLRLPDFASRANEAPMRTQPTDEPPFSGTLLNLPLPPAMISWYQDRAFPAEVLFQDRDRPVLRLPSPNVVEPAAH